MILHLKTETLMWLLPCVFMLHDFEEIIMFQPWLNKHWPDLAKRFPGKVLKTMEKQKNMSAPAFTFAVAEEFIILLIFTLIATEFELYNLWTGVMLGFFIHLIIHIGQFIIYRGYVPVIATSIPAAVYCLIALNDMNYVHPLEWGMVTIFTVSFLVIIVLNMMFALKLAHCFDKWLTTHYSLTR